jgi:hypothetical protein
MINHSDLIATLTGANQRNTERNLDIFWPLIEDKAASEW